MSFLRIGQDIGCRISTHRCYMECLPFLPRNRIMVSISEQGGAFSRVPEYEFQWQIRGINVTKDEKMKPKWRASFDVTFYEDYVDYGNMRIPITEWNHIVAGYRRRQTKVLQSATV